MIIEVVPDGDSRPHRLGGWCRCGARTEAGVTIHNAFDMRELVEQLTGEGTPGKEWVLVEVEPQAAA